MNKRSETALRILQLLLRCGMICQEELEIVLETMATAQGNKKVVPLSTEGSGPRSRQSSLVFEVD